MADFIKHPVVEVPDRAPEPVFSQEELRFTPQESAQIERFREMYPTNQGAVMHTLWLAQEKFGFLPPEVLQLVARTLEIPYPIVYGVMTFYSQYYRERRGKYVLDVCTCFTCQVCGGYDILHYLEEQLGIRKGETTDDGLFTIQEVECLGACGSGPMLQITNRHFVHNLTPEKIDRLLADLREDRLPGFVSVTLPQDQAELGGNRRTDADGVEQYVTQPIAREVG